MALVGLDVSGSADELLGALAILLAAVGYAAGPMIIKRHLADLDPRAMMAAALPIAALRADPPAALGAARAAPPAEAIAAILVLGLFCTAAAFVLFGALIAEVGAGPRDGHHLRRAGGGGRARRDACWASARAPARSPGCC